MCLALLPAGVVPLSAQGAGRIQAGDELRAGSEIDSYLRSLQSLGKVRPYAWSARSYSPREGEQLAPQDSLHPWNARFHFAGPAGRYSARRVHAARPDLLCSDLRALVHFPVARRAMVVSITG